MSEWTDLLFEFLVVSSLYMAAAGILVFGLARVRRCRPALVSQLCVFVLLLPVLISLQWALPHRRPAPPVEGSVVIQDLDEAPATLSAGTSSSDVDVRAQVSLGEDVLISDSKTHEASSRHASQWLLGAWMLGTSLMVLRFLWMAFRALRVLVRSRPVFDPECHRALAKAIKKSTLSRSPLLRESKEIDVPMVPALPPRCLLLPEKRNYREGDLELVFLHEIAHLERRHGMAVWVEHMVRIVYFFHPLVHWALGRIQEERECVCDRDVVRRIGRRASYAELLLRFLGSPSSSSSSLALPLASGGSAPYRRVKRLLEETLMPRISYRERAATVTAVLSMIAGVLFLPGLAPAALSLQQDVAKAAVERGLAYLEDLQREDGTFIGHVGYKLNRNYRITEANVPHVQTTALAARAFLVQENLSEAHKTVVRKARRALVDSAGDVGFISRHGSRSTGHAMAVRFLAETLEMEEDADTRETVEKGVAYMTASQHKNGGWGFVAGDKHANSIQTAAHLEALLAARRQKVEVRESVLKKGFEYLRKCRLDELNGSFRFQPSARARTTFRIDSAAVATSLYLEDPGWESLEWLIGKLERGYEFQASMFGDSFLYYSSLVHTSDVLRRLAPPRRKVLGELMRTDLIAHQLPRGYWANPNGPGEVWATACAVLALSAPR